MATMRAWRLMSSATHQNHFTCVTMLMCQSPAKVRFASLLRPATSTSLTFFFAKVSIRNVPACRSPGLAVASMLSARELASKSAPVSLAWLPFLTGVMQNKHL